LPLFAEAIQQQPNNPMLLKKGLYVYIELQQWSRAAAELKRMLNQWAQAKQDPMIIEVQQLIKHVGANKDKVSSLAPHHETSIT